MQITRSSLDTQKGPPDWFTGDVYIDPVAAPAGSSSNPVTWGEHVTEEQYNATPAG